MMRFTLNFKKKTLLYWVCLNSVMVVHLRLTLRTCVCRENSSVQQKSVFTICLVFVLTLNRAYRPGGQILSGVTTLAGPTSEGRFSNCLLHSSVLYVLLCSLSDYVRIEKSHKKLRNFEVPSHFFSFCL